MKKIVLVYPHEYVPEKVHITVPSKVITVVSPKEGGHKWPNVVEATDPLDHPEDVLGVLLDIKKKYPQALFIPFMEEVVLDCAFVNQNIDKWYYCKFFIFISMGKIYMVYYRFVN